MGVMERGLQSLFLMLMLRLNRGIMAAMDTDGPTTDTATMEKDLLMPSLPQMQMPSLSHGGTAITDMGGHTIPATTTTERGLLMPSLPQMPMPSLSHGGMATTDMGGHTTLATITTERGLQMPSLPQMLMPSLNHGGTVATAMLGPTMATTGVDLV